MLVATSLLVLDVQAQGTQPGVALHLDGQWPGQLALELKKDLDASLGERGVRVLADGDAEARATLLISPPSDTALVVRVLIVSRERQLLADRELSLVSEHPDTWSVAIAATADELLAIAWSLPPPASPKSQDEPKPPDQVPTVPPPAPAKVSPPVEALPSLRPELGLGVTYEQYFPRAQTYGVDLFGGMPLGGPWRLEFAAALRKLVPRSSAQGEVDGAAAGGSVFLSAGVSQGRWLGLELLGGAHAAAVWFDASAAEGSEAKPVTAALVSVRGGGRMSVVTSQRSRLGLVITAGLPVVRAAARDAAGDVALLGGVELGARLEAGWQL